MPVKTKICHLTSVHRRYDTRIFLKECRSLAKEGFEVYLIVADDKSDEIKEEVKIISLSKPQNRTERIFLVTRKMFTAALRVKANLYHIHDPELLFAACILKLITKAKIVYDVHEDYPKSIMTKYWIPKVYRVFLSSFVNLIERLLTFFLDAIVPVTDSIEKRFSKHKSVQIRNYPIIEQSDRKTITADHLQQNRDRLLKLIYVGGISKERGIYELLRSLEYVDYTLFLKLEIYGDFISADFKEELQKVKESQRVVFPGWISQEEAKQRMRESDIGFVLFHPSPNHREALPNKMFEYMLAGLPIITSNFTFWEQIVMKYQCGIMVNPLEPLEIAKAIEYLANNPQLRYEMGLRGRKAVCDSYHWHSEEIKLINLYKKLLNY